MGADRKKESTIVKANWLPTDPMRSLTPGQGKPEMEQRRSRKGVGDQSVVLKQPMLGL